MLVRCNIDYSWRLYGAQMKRDDILIWLHSDADITYLLGGQQVIGISTSIFNDAFFECAVDDRSINEHVRKIWHTFAGFQI